MQPEELKIELVLWYGMDASASELFTKRLVETPRISRHCSLSVAVNVDVVNQALNLVLVQLLAEVHHDHAQLLSIYEPIPVLERESKVRCDDCEGGDSPNLRRRRPGTPL